jgi:hypothetical protein
VPFDYEAYRRAFESLDLEAMISFYAPGAHWFEYKPTAPPRAPVHLTGRDTEIREYLAEVAASPIEIVVSDEVIGTRRAAFRMTVAMGEGRRVIEHCIVDLDEDGLITKHVDVEAWD